MSEKIMKMFSRRKRRMKNPGKSNGGFTFVELLVAVIILTTVIVPVLQVFISATKTNTKARTELQASITASSVLESAKSFSLYVFDSQCNLHNTNTFSLVAGQIRDDGSVIKLLKAGGDCAQLKFQSASASDSNYWKIKSTMSTTDWNDTTTTFVSKANDTVNNPTHRYGYIITGIYQTNNRYDAIITFEKAPYQEVTVNGNAFKEENAKSVTSMYNKTYNITVYVFKHNKDGKSAYQGLDLTDKAQLENLNFEVKMTGSKVDSETMPN